MRCEGWRFGMLLAAGSAAVPPAAAQAILPPALELRVPKAPTLATAPGEAFLAYELHVTNFAGQPMTLKRVEVVGAGNPASVLFALSDSALLRSTARPGQTIPLADRTKLSGGSRAVVYLWVPVDPRALPPLLRNRVTVEQGSGDSVRSQMLEGATVPVSAETTELGPPLRGGVWLTGNGPRAESGHRRALITTGGTPTIAQRFAIDFVKVGDDFRTFTGEQLKNESYRAWGNEALAVADGIVVAVKDSIPENIPGATSRAVPITLETVGGNHVILDIGKGRYAFYAHLQPGSLRVKLGDRVRRGQVVGLVGNSGNSTEPHLHFHVSDGNSPLGSEGIPYQYEAFELVGQCTSFGSGCALTAAQTRHGELPLGNQLIRFRE